MINAKAIVALVYVSLTCTGDYLDQNRTTFNFVGQSNSHFHHHHHIPATTTRQSTQDLTTYPAVVVHHLGTLI